MKGCHSIWRTTMVVILLSLFMLLTSGAAIAQPGVNGTFAPALQSYTRALVATALEKVAQARAANHDKKALETTAPLHDVRVLFDLIRAARPTAEVQGLLYYVKNSLLFEDNKQVLADLLPVYTALNAMAPSPMVNTAHNQLDSIKTALENGDRQKAVDVLNEMSQALIVDNVDIPLNAATQDLNNAINTLEVQGKPARDETLLSIEKNLLLMLNTLYNHVQSNG